MNGRQNGWTLIELLVSIAVLSILMGLLLPAVQRVRESSRRTTCLNNLRQIGIGVLNFESTFKRLPDGVESNLGKYPHMSWLVKILPYCEQQNVWQKALDDYDFDSNPFLFHSGQNTVVPLYQCASDPDTGKLQFSPVNGRWVALTNYLGVNGTDHSRRDGLLFSNSRIRIRDITDGQSNTLLSGERPPSPDFWYGWWYAGLGHQMTGSPDMLLGVNELNDLSTLWSTLIECPPGPYTFQNGKRGEMCDTLHYWSYHPGGANFLFCDGSVRFMVYTAHDMIMAALATRAGGEIVNED